MILKNKKIKACVIGATGYTGSELVKILMKHPNVELKNITAKNYVGQRYDNIYENFRNINNSVCEEMNIYELSESCDVIFIALPHGVATNIIDEKVLENTKIIDLGADFRIKNYDIYENWYNVKHNAKDILKYAVYGLCEINRDSIKNTNIVANPGCYTTCSILSLMPLIKENIIDFNSIIIDAKSGVTGSGRALLTDSLYCEVNENLKAYKIASHRHTPEIEQELSSFCDKDINIIFTPHLVPMNRGILVTCYANLNDCYDYDYIKEVYQKYYKDEYFIRITKEDIFPQTRWVKGSNFVDIGFKIDYRTNRIIVVGAIDNIMKGASGQAVQNMNILFGIDEKTGIDFIPSFPV